MVKRKDSPAMQLEGIVLQCGWVIGRRLHRHPGTSGGNFCVTYSATKDGKEAFVKAIDFVEALSQPDPLKRLARLGAEATWERDVLEFCELRAMSRIVRFIAHEDVAQAGYEGDPLRQVSCLVIERGERDLNDGLRTVGMPPHSCRLHILRDVALALDQLHSAGIAHLDVKPSNIVSMLGDFRDIPSSSKSPTAKLTDLGRVVRKGIYGPWDDLGFTGDPNYRPPDKRYGFDPPEWRDNREAADCYMLGSITVFLFTRVPMHTLYDRYVPEEFKDNNWRGEFDGVLVDVLIDAQSKAIATDIGPEFPASIREPLIELVAQLTHPDPRKRGDTRARRQGRIGMESIHQKFYRLAKTMEQQEIGKK